MKGETIEVDAFDTADCQVHGRTLILANTESREVFGLEWIYEEFMRLEEWIPVPLWTKPTQLVLQDIEKAV